MYDGYVSYMRIWDDSVNKDVKYFQKKRKIYNERDTRESECEIQNEIRDGGQRSLSLSVSPYPEMEKKYELEPPLLKTFLVK